MVLLGVTLLFFAGRAHAEDATTAQALFEEGRKLMNDGKFAEACPKLAASQKLDPGAGTLLNLATCYDKNGQSATAWATFKEAAASAHQSGHLDWESAANERSKQLEAGLSRLTIVVPPDADVPGLVVERDGRAVDRAEYGVAIPIDPGVHPVEGTAPKKQRWSTTVTVGPNGDRQSVTIPALAVEQGSEVPAAATTQEPAPSAMAHTPDGNATSGGSTQRTVGLVLGGAGVVGVLVGSVFGLMSKSTHDDALTHCLGTRCTQTGIDLGDKATTQAAISTVSFVAGGVLLAGGAVLYFTATEEPKRVSARVRPQRLEPRVSATRTGASLELGGAW
jgi:hypothetical protein